MKIEAVTDYLGRYPRPVIVMEVCGTHTSAIVKSGLRDLLSPQIRLVSGPGCPVCVTPVSYIDTLVELASQPDTCVLSFGDLFRVPGSRLSLLEAQAVGGRFRVIYSPLEAVTLALENPSTLFVVAAVGFETTAPIYAVLLEELTRQGIGNVRLATALKTMPAALAYLCDNEAVDAFLCPGHVSSIIGSTAYEPLCAVYRRPFVVAGFTPEHILAALYHMLRQLDRGEARVENRYPAAVTERGNEKAQSLLARYFLPADSRWRGIGSIAGSALILRPEYAAFDAGSGDGGEEEEHSGCRCGDVMLGHIFPNECALFGTACRPEHPVGACMVSSEGACGIWHMGRR